MGMVMMLVVPQHVGYRGSFTIQRFDIRPKRLVACVEAGPDVVTVPSCGQVIH
jgi:hypothetical protein